MSERTFRGPRRRGFDDDVYAPRRPRAFGAPASRLPIPSGPPIRATVKWFSPEKGFGFVVLDGDRGDAFLHASVLEQSGHDGATLQPGVTLGVRVGQGQKGPQVDEVLEIDESTAASPPQRRSASGLLPGRMIAGLTAWPVWSSGTVQKSGSGLSPSTAVAARCSFTPLHYSARVSPD